MLELPTIIHYALHLLAPGVFSWVFFKQMWRRSWLLMLTTMIVDTDHLLTTPIFDAGRCSINFHPLHSYYAISIYVLLLFIPNKYVRIIALGLLIHMSADFQDCLWML